MYNPAIFNSQPNTKIKFFDDRTKRHTEEDLEEVGMERNDGKEDNWRKLMGLSPEIDVAFDGCHFKNFLRAPMI
jgi:hypothetical protein